MHLKDPEIRRNFREILDQSAAAFLLDTKGVILEANATAGEWLKCPPLDLAGKQMPALAGPLTALKTGNVWRGEIEIAGVWLDVRLKAMDSSQTFLAVAFNVTEFKTRELAQARACRDLEDFATVAAHDLHEPLRKIRAFSERLTEKLASLLPPEAREQLDRMRAAAGRMQNLIDDLLESARVAHNRAPFAKVDLNQTIRDVLADLEIPEGLPRPDQIVSVGRLPTIEGDATELRRLFQNLLHNALKFRASDRALAVTVFSRDDADEHVIMVKDNGIGFAPENAARIFEGFNRLHSQREIPGTGIGLSICRGIVERHRGKITAKGLAGQGAEFEIRLPRFGDVT